MLTIRCALVLSSYLWVYCCARKPQYWWWQLILPELNAMNISPCLHRHIFILPVKTIPRNLNVQLHIVKFPLTAQRSSIPNISQTELNMIDDIPWLTAEDVMAAIYFDLTPGCSSSSEFGFSPLALTSFMCFLMEKNATLVCGRERTQSFIYYLTLIWYVHHIPIQRLRSNALD